MQNEKTLKAVVIPKSQYVLNGTDYKANIILVEQDTSKEFSAYINDSQTKSENGVIQYAARVNKPGEYTLNGYIDNAQKTPFEGHYSVVHSLAVISADKMNVFYVGLENPVSIAVPGFSQDKVMVSITAGSSIKFIRAGHYSVTCPSGVREVKIDVAVKMDDGTLFRIGTAQFRVKNLARPIVQLGTLHSDDDATAAVIRGNAMRLYASFGNGFVFDGIQLKITGYCFSLAQARGGKLISVTGTSEDLPQEAFGIIRALEPGDKIIIDNITGTGPTGPMRFQPFVIRVK